MKILLDTHILLWHLADHPSEIDRAFVFILSDKFRRLPKSEDNEFICLKDHCTTSYAT
jgi:hypothetical protein